jgi:hypothetical protein
VEVHSKRLMNCQTVPRDLRLRRRVRSVSDASSRACMVRWRLCCPSKVIWRKCGANHLRISFTAYNYLDFEPHHDASLRIPCYGPLYTIFFRT